MEVVERSKIDKRKYATDGRPTSELYPNVPITGFGSWICLLLFVHPVYVLTHTRFLPHEAERRDTRGARSRTDRIGREPSHVIDSGWNNEPLCGIACIACTPCASGGNSRVWEAALDAAFLLRFLRLSCVNNALHVDGELVRNEWYIF